MLSGALVAPGLDAGGASLLGVPLQDGDFSWDGANAIIANQTADGEAARLQCRAASCKAAPMAAGMLRRWALGSQPPGPALSACPAGLSIGAWTLQGVDPLVKGDPAGEGFLERNASVSLGGAAARGALVSTFFIALEE